MTRDCGERHPKDSVSENSQNSGRYNFKGLRWHSSESDQHTFAHSPKVKDKALRTARRQSDSHSTVCMLHWNSMEKVGRGSPVVPLYSSLSECRVALLACSWQLLPYCVSGHCPQAPFCQIPVTSSCLPSLNYTVVFNTDSSALLPEFRNMSICR